MKTQYETAIERYPERWGMTQALLPGFTQLESKPKAKAAKRKPRLRKTQAMENPPCWCGVKNPYYEPLPHNCGGSGIIDCLCGGDFCVCHNHSEVECPGCEDCEREEFGDV
jgi:hypothetical protein